MTVNVDEDRWAELRSALARTSDELAGVVAHAARPTMTAVGHWSLIDTAAHVATVADIHLATLRSFGEADPLAYAPGVAPLLSSATVDTIAQINDIGLREFGPLDATTAAVAVRERTACLLSRTGELAPDQVVDWIGGARLPVAGLLAHYLNELCIHGRDVARAARVPWQIPPTDAATFLDMFVVGLVTCGYGSLLDRTGPVRPGQIVVQFRSAFSSTITMVLRDGRVTVEPAAAPIDVVVTHHPSVLNLMMFGRISKARAVLSGRVRVGGRRPWLLPKFLETVRMPG